ncbi:MAG: VCBS repeat-containing protein [bacterium]|nr:VCBS repeat-containing protein [bacterium]
MKYIILLLLVSLAHAQPYEPTFSLDVTGEINQHLGFSGLQALGDQDGDGYDDIITYLSSGEDTPGLRIYYGNNSGQIEYTEFGRYPPTEYTYGWGDAAFDAGFTIPAGDVNGDGYADIMRDLCVYDFDCEFHTVFFLGGPGVFDTLADWIGDATDMLFTTNVGDYNGDGKDDFTKRTLNTGSFGFYLGDFPLSNSAVWSRFDNYSAHMGFGDVNHDGYSDFGRVILLSDSGYVRAELFLGSPAADSLPALVRVRPSGAGGTFEYYHRIVGDINGDTYDDIISYVTSFVSGTRKYVYWGSEIMDLAEDVVLEWANDDVPLYVAPLGDINADGFDDFAHYRDYLDPPTNRIEVWLGGNPLPTTPAWVLDGALDGMNYPYRIGQAGDFNGDGIDDWFFSTYHGLEARGRIIVVAGDRDFGLPVNEHPVVTPTSFILHPCYPNPFNSNVTIPLEITGGGMQQVTLSILNPLGQVVYQFDQESFTPGAHLLRWNATSSSGRAVASGTYFLQAHSQYQNSVQPLHLIK